MVRRVREIEIIIKCYNSGVYGWLGMEGRNCGVFVEINMILGSIEEKDMWWD